LINGDFQYRDWGLLDRTHIRFFGLRNMEALFAHANLKIIEARYVTTPPEGTEFAESWATLSLSLRKALMKSVGSEVYQVVVKAVPVDSAGDALSLIPPEQRWKPPVFGGFGRWKHRLGRHLSARAKEGIRNTLRLLGVNI
jgi:hypothetical protein